MVSREKLAGAGASGAIAFVVLALATQPGRAAGPGADLSLGQMVRAAGIDPAKVIGAAAGLVTSLDTSAVTPAGDKKRVDIRADSFGRADPSFEGLVSFRMSIEANCRTGKVRAGPVIGYPSYRAVAPGWEVRPRDKQWRTAIVGSSADHAWRYLCDPAFRAPTIDQAAPEGPKGAPERTQADIVPVKPWSTASAAAARPSQPPVAAVVPHRGLRARLQVTSAPTESEARSAIDQLKTRHQVELAGVETQIARANLGGRQVFRGLLLFSDEATAERFCTQLNASQARLGRGCFLWRAPARKAAR